MGLSEGDEERQDWQTHLIAALRHVLVHHPVQGQQLLEDVHEGVGVLVGVGVTDQAGQRLQHRVLQLLVADAVEEGVHDHVTTLHRNSELDPGLHTLARLQQREKIYHYWLMSSPW